MLSVLKAKFNDLQRQKRSTVFRDQMFNRILPSKLAELEKHAIEKKFSGKESIFFQDDPADYVWMVKEGFIKEVHHSTTGRDTILSVVGAGGLFGVSAFSNQEYGYQGLTGSSAAVVLSFHIAIFRRLMGNSPELAAAVLGRVSDLLRHSKDSQAHSREDVEKRIIRALLDVAIELGGAVPMTRREISELVGSTVETCIRVISRLEKEGFLVSTRGKIVLKNLVGMRARLVQVDVTPLHLRAPKAIPL